jgi:type VI secretion system Hcp family effector
MVIKIGKIKGESGKKGVTDWIEVKNIDHSMSQDITEANMAKIDSAGFAKFSFLSITKQVDISTSDIHAHCATGKKIDTVELKVFKSKANTDGKTLLAYKLENCFIASANIYADEAGDPMEDVSISYSKIHLLTGAVKSEDELSKGFDLVNQCQI